MIARIILVCALLVISCTVPATLDGPEGWYVCRPHDPTWKVYRFHTDTLEIRAGYGMDSWLSFTTDAGENVTLTSSDDGYACNPEMSWEAIDQGSAWRKREEAS